MLDMHGAQIFVSAILQIAAATEFATQLLEIKRRDLPPSLLFPEFARPLHTHREERERQRPARGRERERDLLKLYPPDCMALG